MARQLSAMLALSLIASFSSAPASAQALQPFTTVKDVCPTCPKKATDVVTLRNDTKITGQVIAENQAFVVIARYGELRMVPVVRIKSMTWATGNAPSNLTSQDQLLLKNGHVLTGTIIEEKAKPGLFRLQASSSRQTYVVFKAQVAQAFRGGQPYTF